MNAVLIAVGTELLRFGQRDTNSDWLTAQLGSIGIEVRARSMVEDDVAAIAAGLRAALARAEVVLVTGGLGPTEDDRTREGLAAGLRIPLERDAQCELRLRQLFESRGRRFTERHAKQADRPRGAEWLENRLGSAPGLLIRRGEGRVFVLPGVPAEMESMFTRCVLPRLARRSSRCLLRRTLRVGGRPEESVDAQLQDLYDTSQTAVTVLCGAEGIELHLRAEGASVAEVRSRLDDLDRRMSDRLGPDLSGRDDDTLATVVGRLLAERGETLATAESCTAGLLAASITVVPGASAWFRGGLVVYSDDLKQRLAGVSAELLAAHGAVSEEVARALAEAARARCATDWGVGLTGIAGPSGGSADKPVGLVYLAITGPAQTSSWSLRKFGDRELVRSRSVATALDQLRRMLQGHDAG